MSHKILGASIFLIFNLKMSCCKITNNIKRLLFPCITGKDFGRYKVGDVKNYFMQTGQEGVSPRCYSWALGLGYIGVTEGKKE